MTHCQHPLLIDLVAKEILKYSKLEDLAAHRLVCKTWFEASLSQWRSTATLTILQRKLTGNGVAVASGSGSNQPSTTTTTAEMPGSHSSALWVNDSNDDGGCGGVTLSKLKLIVAKKTKDVSSSFLQLESKPFAKYKLKRWAIHHTPSLKRFVEGDYHYYQRRKIKFQEFNKNELICGAEDFPQFWETFGPLMQSLTIDEFEFVPVHNTSLLAIIFHHTPNLEELKLSRNNFPGNDIHEFGFSYKIELTESFLELPLKTKLKTLALDGAIPVSLRGLLQLFPNLESLTLQGWRPFYEVAQAVEGVLVKPKLTPIKHLNITMYETANADTAFELIQMCFHNALIVRECENRERGGNPDDLKQLLQLKTLELGAMAHGSNGMEFLKMVSDLLHWYVQFGGLLEVIKLYMTPFCEHPSELRMMRTNGSVKHFEIWGNWLKDLAFLRWMPNLERLEVHNSCFEKWDQIWKPASDMDSSPITNVNQDVVQNSLCYDEMKNYVGEHFKSVYIDYEFGEGSLKTLSKWMPQLKELKTILNNETLQTVCGLWGDLEKLDLLYGSSLDDDGITGIGDRNPGQNLKQQINLTSLQNLKSFRLETYCGQSKLGDLSATKGFLKMKTLQTLEICVSPQMSLEVETQLRNAIVNAKIIRNYGENEPAHLSYGKCCKRLQFFADYEENARQLNLADS